MQAEGTPSNEDLARIVNARIAAENSRVTWATIRLRVAGLVGAVVMGGAGTGLAALGIATVLRAQPDTDAVARRTAAILSAGGTVTVRGTVGAAGQVALADGGTVRVDPASSVKLADGARVRLVPENEPPRPTEAQMRTGQTARNGIRVATDFTVFKSVSYNKGTVVTGWRYANSEQTRPGFQYCYYLESVESNSSVKIDLAHDGKYLSPRSPVGFNPVDAATNCVWYN